jgi:CPA2 family monovalent cation:H+ antiporter-2
MEETLKHADIIPVLYKCLLIFGIAGLIVPLFNRMHVSPVIGFLVSGILISPNLLTAFDMAPLIDLDSVNLMGELGILALLFMIGLELSFEKLKELKKYIFGLGSAQVLVTGSIIACIALFFGNELQTSIIIGFGFALSSTAIVMQLLKEYKLDRKANGRISFSILLMQDMAVVPILVMIGAFAASASEQSSTPLIVILSLAFASIAVGIIYFIGKKILQPVLHKIVGTNKNEWLVTFVLFIVCLISITTQKIGLSAGLGAFLAGLMIAETEFCEKIEKILYPLKSLLLGVFFVSIGMMVDIAEILSNPILLAMSVVGIFFVKGLTLYPLCRSFGMKRKHASEIAMTLCQPGEFTLMVISVSMAVNLLPIESAQFFLLVTVLGMLVTPFVFKFLPSVRKQKQVCLP